MVYTFPCSTTDQLLRARSGAVDEEPLVSFHAPPKQTGIFVRPPTIQPSTETRHLRRFVARRHRRLRACYEFPVADVRRVGDFAPQETTDVIDLVSLEVKPEFVAQLAAYVQSSQRQAGLHTLVDVGGGILDVVTFNVHQRDGEDTFPFFVPEVRPLGTHGLLQNRLLAAGVSARQTPIDELAPVQSATELAALASIRVGPVVQRDKLFRHAVKSCVGQVLELTKRRRYRLSEA